MSSNRAQQILNTAVRVAPTGIGVWQTTSRTGPSTSVLIAPADLAWLLDRDLESEIKPTDKELFRVKRTIGRLNTETDDGRIIRKLHLSNEPIPVLVRDQDETARIVGTALVTITDDDIVADIDLRTTVTKFEDLIPHMSCVVVNPEADELALANIYLNDQPDAFGDLNR